MGTHHRLIKGVRGNITAAADSHLTDHAQAIDFGIDRTQTVGQLFRQHRDNAPGKVHGITALNGDGIQCRIRLHVIGDIGDGHQQAPTVAIRFTKHCIIEISRISAIYRHQRGVA